MGHERRQARRVGTARLRGAACTLVLALGFLASSLVVATPANASSQFSDVWYSTSHAVDIFWLDQEGISTGWVLADGTREFRPNAQIARGDMAAFLYRLAGSPSYTTPAASPFRDVTPTTSHYREICWLAETGISTGWRNADGTSEFRPNSPVARGDMAAFLYRLAASGVGRTYDYYPFKDVSAETAHAHEITWLADSGISKGWTNADGTRSFRPNSPIARGDMAAFLHRLGDESLTTPDAAIAEAEAQGLMTFKGMVRVRTAWQLAQDEGATELFAESGWWDDANQYAVLRLEEPQTLTAHSTPYDIDTRTTSELGLSVEGMDDWSYWQAYAVDNNNDRLMVVVAVDPDEAWWQTDVSLPMYALRTYEAAKVIYIY